MRVAILSQYFLPEPITRLEGVVRGLRSAGHRVEVLTSIPTWPQGRLYPGYRPRVVHEETILGARVVRTFAWPYRGRVAWRRLLNYGSFAATTLVGAQRLGKFDVLYVYHPPLTVTLPAWLIATARGRPFILDVQDLWPDAGVSAGALGRGLIERSVASLARWAYRRAAHITVIAPEFREELIRQRVPAHKVSVVSNWANEAIFQPRSPSDARRRFGLSESSFLVVYSGNLGSTHGVDYVLSAAKLLSGERRFAFAIAGTGPEAEHLAALARRLGVESVRFLGHIEPPGLLPELYAAADVLLVHMRRSRIGAASLPSRMLAYMACGRPMLVASEGAPRVLVERTGCGATCAPEDPPAIAAAIRRLANEPERLREMGACGRRAYLAEFSEEAMVRKLVTLVESIGHG